MTDFSLLLSVILTDNKKSLSSGRHVEILTSNSDTWNAVPTDVTSNSFPFLVPTSEGNEMHRTP